MIPRALLGKIKASSKSIVLLGPRQTGKSTLIDELGCDLKVNLANEETYLEFARNPAELRQRLAVGGVKRIFIDEVQRLPSLLNTVQALIDESKGAYRFYL